MKKTQTYTIEGEKKTTRELWGNEQFFSLDR